MASDRWITSTRNVVAHPELSLASGRSKGWDARNQYYFQMLATLAQHYGFDVETPFSELPQSAQDVVLHGSGETELAFAYTNERGRKICGGTHSKASFRTCNGAFAELTRRLYASQEAARASAVSGVRRYPLASRSAQRIHR